MMAVCRKERSYRKATYVTARGKQGPAHGARGRFYEAGRWSESEPRALGAQTWHSPEPPLGPGPPPAGLVGGCPGTRAPCATCSGGGDAGFEREYFSLRLCGSKTVFITDFKSPLPPRPARSAGRFPRTFYHLP